MLQKMCSMLFILLAGALLASCCSLQNVESAFTPVDLFNKGYTKKVDTFVILLDSSSSMADCYNKQTKLDVAKETTRRINASLPELDYRGGLRMFGPARPEGNKGTTLLYGVNKYNTAELRAGIDKVELPGGLTPMAEALNATAADLEGSSGKIALIIISDGEENVKSSLEAVEALRKTFGDRLCIYTVTVGASPAGQKLMGEIATAGGCGFSVGVDEIYTPEGMADFVKKVFIQTDGDSDGDGVLDRSDKCPGTPSGVKVDAKGCPLDSDGDGVYDYQDKCPDTPKGEKVDKNGCPLNKDADNDGITDADDRCPNSPAGAQVDANGCWQIAPVYFDFNKSNVKISESAKLAPVAAVMKNNPDLKAKVEGHTDNKGKENYNQKLSEKRVKAVLDFFKNMGIDLSRFEGTGFGFSRPAADNDTKENRAKNRRVEIIPERQ